MSSIADLYALQEVDLAIDANREALADAQSRLGEPEELVEARRSAEEGLAKLREEEKRFKEREWDADELRFKIEPLERRLYEGSVRDPRELADLERDVESLKRRRSELEDQALAAMEVVEEAQRAADEARRSLEEMTGTSMTEQENLQGRQATLEGEFAVLEERRSAQASGINGAVLPLYERIRAARQGRAVAKVEGGACQGCRISLPINLVKLARSGSDMVQCINCERILYMS